MAKYKTQAYVRWTPEVQVLTINSLQPEIINKWGNSVRRIVTDKGILEVKPELMELILQEHGVAQAEELAGKKIAISRIRFGEKQYEYIIDKA